MYQFPRIIIFIVAVFSFINVTAQNSPISIELRPKNSVFKLPASSNDWFEVAFDCTIKNSSAKTIGIVDPKAYKIFPHPWSIAVNNKEAKFWPGDIRCAPSFKKEDIIELQPGAVITKTFTWHVFVQNFTRESGIYKAKVKYDYTADGTFTMGVSNRSITSLHSNWSNEATFSIVK